MKLIKGFFSLVITLIFFSLFLTSSVPALAADCGVTISPLSIPINTPTQITATAVNPYGNFIRWSIGFLNPLPAGSLSNFIVPSGWSASTGSQDNFWNAVGFNTITGQTYSIQWTQIITGTTNTDFDMHDNHTSQDCDQPFTFTALVPTPTPIPPPAINQVPDTTIRQIDTYSENGSFTDPNSTSWTATVDYGDNTGTQTLPLSGNNFTLNHAYNSIYLSPGIYTVTVKIINFQGVTGTMTTHVTVKADCNATISPLSIPVNTPTTITATAANPFGNNVIQYFIGQNYPLPIGSFSNFVIPDEWQSAIGGNNTEWAAFNPNGILSGQTYSILWDQTIPGTITTDLYIHDNNTEQYCDQPFTLTTFVPTPTPTPTPAPTPMPPTVTITGPTQVNEGDTNRYTLTVSDLGIGDSFSIYGSPSCGSGTYVQGSLNLTSTGGTFDCTFSHSDNNTSVGVQVTDSNGTTSNNATLPITVANVAPSVGTITAPSSPVTLGSSITVSASFTDPGIGDTFTGTINWGDTSSSNGTIIDTNGTWSISGTHTYTNPGTYTITLSVTDSSGDSTPSTTQITVHTNVAPVVAPLSDAQIVAGTTYTATGSFTDPDSSSWTATVDYGDGSGSQALTLNADNSFNLSHQYATAGTYTLTVSVTDNQGATGTETATIGVTPASQFVLGINAGGDSAGNYVADTNVTGGSTYSVTDAVDTTQVVNPAPQVVYQSSRYGNFTYSLTNLTPGGQYTLRLHFNELYWGTWHAGFFGGVGSRVFNVTANGTQELSNFDIFSTAGGANTAITEQFPVTPDSNGTVTVDFSTVTDNALVNGIELYSGTLPVPPPPTPLTSVSINAGGNAAGSYITDTGFSGGTPYTSTNPVDTTGVTSPAPEAVYQSVRYGNTFSYRVAHLAPNTSYHVNLHFNELYWDTSYAGNNGGVGSRVFNVDINGTNVLSNFDIFATAGGANKAIVEPFTTSSDANGNITISFTTVTDNAMVNGIDVFQ